MKIATTSDAVPLRFSKLERRVVSESSSARTVSLPERASKTTRNVELSTIVGVTAHQQTSWFACGCAADEVTIDLNRELGLSPVPPLKVESGMGEHVAALIRAAVEEAHEGMDGNPPDANAAMLRA